VPAGRSVDATACPWYAHEPARFDEFVARYRVELEEPERALALVCLRERSSGGVVTLLTATKPVEISHAEVLARLLEHGGWLA
jgi:uncharacterized protein YeaO (DUF488 family)